jgi:hypothetical protein
MSVDAERVRSSDISRAIVLQGSCEFVESSLALSCCGILTDREIFDPGKNRNRSAVDSKIFPDGNAHLYQLGANLRQ